METAAGVSAVSRGISLPINSPQSSRKEWRVVAEQSIRNSSSEELERSKLGLSDERLMSEVQQGRKPADIDFCLVATDGILDNDILSHRLHSLVKQREELQQMEIGLRAKLIARDEIMEMRSAYDSQLTDHANANAKLQEQLIEKEQTTLELERKLEEKERELHAIRLHNEAAWAKDDLLREQSIELQTYRRERDNSESERAQHIKQIHDLQEHLQEKERQFLELQEQSKIFQETLLFKDEQLREAQAWMTRVQEMDALQSSTNHSLQAELRERTEHCNQLWLGCQRQFGEMERLRLLIQQLQIELADVSEKNGTYSDGSHVSQPNSKEHSQIGENNGGQLDVGGNSTPQISGLLSNENPDIASFISMGNTSRQTEHVRSVPISPTSFVGMPTYLPPGQMAAMHPFVVHQQGMPHSHIGPFHSVPAFSSLQHWHNQQTVPEDKQQSTLDQHSSLNSESILLGSDSRYGYETSVNGQVLESEYLNANVSQGIEPRPIVHSSDVEGKVEKSYSSGGQDQIEVQKISSQFGEVSRLDSFQNSDSIKEITSALEGQSLTEDKPGSTSNLSSYDETNHLSSCNESSTKTSDVALPDSLGSPVSKSAVLVGNMAEAPLLDERVLLACIARTIPPGGKIRISSTLPNRLGKMIAPLHWHDYKRKYGKLDEFVASHPELFVIEGDYIQLLKGAQETIAAITAVAKVAAAVSATSSYSPQHMASVAMTPMADSHLLKKVSSSIDSNSNSKPDNLVFKSYNVTSSRDMKTNHVPNGATTFNGSTTNGSTHWRTSANAVGKQLNRTNGANNAS